jgi:hypothetical protein
MRFTEDDDGENDDDYLSQGGREMNGSLIVIWYEWFDET